MKIKLNTFDATKDYITFLISIMGAGIAFITLISTDIGSLSFVVPIINFSIIINKTFILVNIILLTIYALFQIYVSRNIIHNRIMVIGFAIIFAHVYLLVLCGVIIEKTASALLILLSVAFIMSYINLLHKT